MTKTETTKLTPKAKWEAPELTTLDADLTSIEAARFRFALNLSITLPNPRRR